MEGKQDAMGARLDRLESLVTEGFKSIQERLDKIDQRESERKGAWKTIVGAASLIGGAVGWLATKIF